jgi:hypothetical protein
MHTANEGEPTVRLIGMRTLIIASAMAAAAAPAGATVPDSPERMVVPDAPDRMTVPDSPESWAAAETSPEATGFSWGADEVGLNFALPAVQHFTRPAG